MPAILDRIGGVWHEAWRYLLVPKAVRDVEDEGAGPVVESLPAPPPPVTGPDDAAAQRGVEERLARVEYRNREIGRLAARRRHRGAAAPEQQSDEGGTP